MKKLLKLLPLLSFFAFFPLVAFGDHCGGITGLGGILSVFSEMDEKIGAVCDRKIFFKSHKIFFAYF